MNLLILNGPNLNLLGIREPAIYGSETYGDLVDKIQAHGREIGVSADVRQSNHEGTLVDWIQEARGHYDGIVINPAAYTHTSIAIPDALRAVQLPAVEVHLSDIRTREAYRRISYTREACLESVIGKGTDGYLIAMDLLRSHIAGGGT